MRNVPGFLGPDLTAASIDHDIKVYPDAGHGFINKHSPDDLSRLDKMIGRLTAAGYHEPSARDARVRILAFFRAYLTDAPADSASPSGHIHLEPAGWVPIQAELVHLVYRPRSAFRLLMTLKSLRRLVRGWQMAQVL